LNAKARFKKKISSWCQQTVSKHLIDYSGRSEITVLSSIIFDQKFLKNIYADFEINIVITL